MTRFWRSHTGKLVMGGCGTQVGLLFTCGALAALFSFCLICALANGLIFGQRQALAAPPANLPDQPPHQSSPARERIEFLLGAVDLLLAEVDALERERAAIPAPPDAAAGQTPAVIAAQEDVSLYSGPGFDFDRIGLLPRGERLGVVGRSPDGEWWLIAMPDGLFGWVSALMVRAENVEGDLPIVTAPSLLDRPGSGSAPVAASPTLTPTATARPTPPLPPGTPTPEMAASRQFVEEMPSYRRVKAGLLVPPVSSSISPDGSKIAMTERIKLYTFTTEGAHTDIWLEEDDKQGPLGWVVWSPDGQHLAFVVGFKTPKCQPCESVAILRLSDGVITFLEAPDDQDTDAPRWTQDGRLLVNVHPGEPADGVTYVYDAFGRGEEASGVYVLSSSHEGQKWFPWLPGRIWRAGVAERPDSYVHDQ